MNTVPNNSIEEMTKLATSIVSQSIRNLPHEQHNDENASFDTIIKEMSAWLTDNAVQIDIPPICSTIASNDTSSYIPFGNIDYEAIARGQAVTIDLRLREPHEEHPADVPKQMRKSLDKTIAGLWLQDPLPSYISIIYGERSNGKSKLKDLVSTMNEFHGEASSQICGRIRRNPNNDPLEIVDVHQQFPDMIRRRSSNSNVDNESMEDVD